MSLRHYRGERTEKRKDIHNYHSNLYSQIDESSSQYSYSTSIDDMLGNKKQMKETTGTNGKSSIAKYRDTWTSNNSAKTTVTNL